MSLLLAVLLACGVGRDLDAGRAALDRGDLMSAEDAYRRVLDDEPANVEALYGLGRTWHLAGRDEMAREAFQQLVDTHPESPFGHKGLGSIATGERNAAAARRHYQDALALAPDDVGLRYDLGLVALSQGQGEDAMQVFTTLAEADPTRAEFEQARAEALMLLERDEEALTASSRAVGLGGVPRVHALALHTRARALLTSSAGRVETTSCDETAPPVHAWLVEADRVLDLAEATGVALPELAETRRGIRRRRGNVDDLCPGLRAGR